MLEGSEPLNIAVNPRIFKSTLLTAVRMKYWSLNGPELSHTSLKKNCFSRCLSTMPFYELDWIWTLDQVINLTWRTIVSKIDPLRVECHRHCAYRDVPGTARNYWNHWRQLDAQDGPLPPNKNTCILLPFISDSKTAIHRWDHLIWWLRKS